MPAIVTSRVVAEFYRGIDFPSDWAQNEDADVVDVGMAHDRVMSAIVMLDANEDPLAACWQVTGKEEQFVRIRFDEGSEDDLLDDFNDDLRKQSLKLGDPDLLATLLWEPEELRPNQAIYAQRQVSVGVRYPRLVTVWNLPQGEILANASNLLLVILENSNGLSLAVPASLDEMHAATGTGARQKFLVLPTNPAIALPADEEPATRKVFAWTLLLLLAALILGALAVDWLHSLD